MPEDKPEHLIKTIKKPIAVDIYDKDAIWFRTPLAEGKCNGKDFQIGFNVSGQNIIFMFQDKHYSISIKSMMEAVAKMRDEEEKACKKPPAKKKVVKKKKKE